MLRRCVRNERAFIARRCAPVLLLLLGFLVLAPPSRAQVTLGPVTVGAGLRTSFVHTEPDGGGSTDQFLLDSARLYVNGPVTDKIKFMFNTEYDGATNKIGVLDAVARFELSPKFNIWAGRFLPPSDRANLYGPFYAHEWAVYTDGIQDGYPFVFQGRDNGVVYWGDFGKKMKVSAGAFDGKSATGNPNVIGAARVQIDFWDAEDGYYLNGTYYGDKNLLGHRRSDSGSIRQHRVNRRFPPRKETAQRRRRFDRKPSMPTTTGWAGTTGPMPRARGRMGWEATSFRKRSAWVSSRSSASMPRRSLPTGQPRATTRKPPK